MFAGYGFVFGFTYDVWHSFDAATTLLGGFSFWSIVFGIRLSK